MMHLACCTEAHAQLHRLQELERYQLKYENGIETIETMALKNHIEDVTPTPMPKAHA